MGNSRVISEQISETSRVICVMIDNNLQSNDLNDEILVLDESGKFKILSGGELKPYDLKFETKANVASPKPLTAVMDTGMEEPMLQPPPPMVRKKTATFYFHPEDEEEVAKAHPPLDLPPQKQYSLDKITSKVIDSFQLTLADELKKRLRIVIYTYLRDRRTLVDAIDVLKRPKIDGGLELTSELSDRILIFLKEIKEKIIQEKGLVIDEQLEKPSIMKKAVKALAVPLSSSTPLEIKKAETTPVIKEKVVSAVPLRPQDSQAKPLLFKRPLKKWKIAVADIQKDYKLVGPVEELASLSLPTLRRLGATSQDQVQKILTKVNLLGEDSLAKKAAGIQGWRKSPLYKMYLAIGQASLEHGLTVAEIINQYHLQGKEIMTLGEFEAISDLNKLLRF